MDDKFSDDTRLIVWYCDDYLSADGFIKYENVLNQLKRNNKQNIALTDDKYTFNVLSSATDLFLNVYMSNNLEKSIKFISEKYRIRPKNITIVYDGITPPENTEFNIIDVNNLQSSLDKGQNFKTQIPEPPEVLAYRERRYTSKEEAIKLLREIYRKCDTAWVRHELTDLLRQSNNRKDQSEAYRLCKSFAAKDPEMKFKLAEMYRMGIGTDKNTEEYVINLKSSMMEGSTKAKYEWIKYVIEKKIAEEYEETIKLLDESDPQLRGYMARMYRYGYGVKKDIDRAIDLMGSSASDGIGWARNELTDLLILRNSGDDAEQAFEKCSEFASEGDAWAKGRLARMYRDGVGIEKDTDKAISLMSEAAKSGVSWAKKELEDMLCNGASVQIPKDVNKYIFDNTERAFKEIESIYETEPEVAKDVLEKIEELNKILMNPDIDTYLMKYKVEYGEGSIEALNGLMNLALGGNRIASEFLGLIYSEGKKIERNIDFAITYTRLSLKGKSGKEINRLIDLLIERGKNEDLSEAFEICLESSQEGDLWSTARLGRIYKNGHGVEKDMDKAIEYLRTASDGGVPWAKDELKWLLGQRNTAQDVKELKKLK